MDTSAILEPGDSENRNVECGTESGGTVVPGCSASTSRTISLTFRLSMFDGLVETTSDKTALHIPFMIRTAW